MRIAKLFVLSTFSILGFHSYAAAQDKPVCHSSESCAMVAAASANAVAADRASSPSTKEYETANNTMHRDMNINFTGDADYDFVAGMIPHHQGAIDMAEVVLRHGKDRRVRQLARDIIWAQKQEIRMMEYWKAQMEKDNPDLKKRAQEKAASSASHNAHAGHHMPALAPIAPVESTATTTPAPASKNAPLQPAPMQRDTKTQNPQHHIHH